MICEILLLSQALVIFRLFLGIQNDQERPEEELSLSHLRLL